MGSKNKVMVIGASGLVGAAAANEFLNEGWDVVAVSRRKPEVDSAREYQHLPLDLQNADACRDAMKNMGDVTHVVYAAVYEMPGLMPGWSDPAQMSTNISMMENIMNPLSEVAKGLRHVNVLQGTKAYGAHLHEIPIPAREDAPRDNHANFYWLQEDYIRANSVKYGYAFTIWRPQLIVGPNYGVVMNLPPVIGAYAAICKKLGMPFAFPGGTRWVWEAVDTRLVASALCWAASEPKSHGQTYNITNGEVFDWRTMWPAMAKTLGAEVGEDSSLSLAEFLPANAGVWQEIVKEHGLRPLSIEEVCGESHHYADMCFMYGSDLLAPYTFLSTAKLRQHGFSGAYNTEESFCHWLSVLQDRKVIPARN